MPQKTYVNGARGTHHTAIKCASRCIPCIPPRAASPCAARAFRRSPWCPVCAFRFIDQSAPVLLRGYGVRVDMHPRDASALATERRLPYIIADHGCTPEPTGLLRIRAASLPYTTTIPRSRRRHPPASRTAIAVPFDPSNASTAPLAPTTRSSRHLATDCGVRRGCGRRRVSTRCC